MDLSESVIYYSVIALLIGLTPFLLALLLYCTALLSAMLLTCLWQIWHRINLLGKGYADLSGSFRLLTYYRIADSVHRIGSGATAQIVFPLGPRPLSDREL